MPVRNAVSNRGRPNSYESCQKRGVGNTVPPIQRESCCETHLALVDGHHFQGNRI